jgi:hypothetical protein
MITGGGRGCNQSEQSLARTLSGRMGGWLWLAGGHPRPLSAGGIHAANLRRSIGCSEIVEYLYP